MCCQGNDVRAAVCYCSKVHEEPPGPMALFNGIVGMVRVCGGVPAKQMTALIIIPCHRPNIRRSLYRSWDLCIYRLRPATSMPPRLFG